MKLSSQLAKFKLQKMKTAAPKPVRAARGKPARRRWVWPAIGLVALGVGTFAVLEFFIWNRLPPALVGTWEVQDGPMQGGTFDFARDGTLKMRAKEGPEVQMRVRVDGKSLRQTTQNPMTLREETHTSTIRELTANSLVLELELGDVLRMARKR